MAKIPNARNYRARINHGSPGSTLRAQGPTRRNHVPVTPPAQAGRGGRVAALLAGTVVLLLIGGPKAALIGGVILAILLFLP